LLAALTLCALAAIGDQYVMVSSEVIHWVALIYLAATLLDNMAWFLQISEDLLQVVAKVNSPKQSHLAVSSYAVSPMINLSDSKSKGQKSPKSETKEVVSVSIDFLSESEKEFLLQKLTDKEKEVFLLAAEGKKNGEIASFLNLSEASVKVYRSRVTGKLGFKKPEDLKKLIGSLSVKSVENASLGSLDDPKNLPVGIGRDLF
jgi:DNA-binding CsgD family transcriptional regulator